MTSWQLLPEEAGGPGLGAALADLVDPPNLRYRLDPVGWAQSRGVELWSAQERILRAVADEPLVTVQSCHGVGKSFTAALTCCWWLDTRAPDAFVVTTAPTDAQVRAILWREINRFHAKLNLAGRTNLTEWYLGKQLIAFGRKPSDYDPTAFQGIHARHVLVVLDEACGIPTDIWDAAVTLGTGAHSRLLAIGNPDDAHSVFAQRCETPGWRNLQIGYRDTPNFTAERRRISVALRELLVSREWVAQRAIDWGEGSALFTSKCEGQFPRGTSPFVTIPVTWVDACRVEDPEAEAELDPVADAALETEAGVDVGAGVDRMVVWLRRGRRALHRVEFRESDPVRAVGAVALLLREWDVAVVKVDPIGVGWNVAGRLRELSSLHFPTGEGAHHAKVVGVNFAEKPDRAADQKRFLNKRAEAWWLGRELSRAGDWDLRALDAATIQELTTPLYEIVDSSGKVKIQAKDEVIKVLGRSPDSADALLLAFWDRSGKVEVTSAETMTRSLLANVGPTDLLGGGDARAGGPVPGAVALPATQVLGGTGGLARGWGPPAHTDL